MSEKKSNLTLILGGTGLDEDDIYTHTRALRRMLEENLEEGEVSHAESKEATPGAKGDPIELFSLGLSMIGSGSLSTLINSIKSIFVREKRLKITVKTEQGREVSIDAENIHDERTLKLLESLLLK